MIKSLNAFADALLTKLLPTGTAAASGCGYCTKCYPGCCISYRQCVSNTGKLTCCVENTTCGIQGGCSSGSCGC